MVWIYIGRTGFTLLRKFGRFRRAELPDEYKQRVKNLAPLF